MNNKNCIDFHCILRLWSLLCCIGRLWAPSLALWRDLSRLESVFGGFVGGLGGPKGGSKARSESTQGPSGTFPSTPGDALGAPKAAPNPPKTLSRCVKSFRNAKEGAQSLPNATQEAPKPQSTLKSMKIKRFSYYTWLIHQGFQSPPGAPRARPADT